MIPRGCAGQRLPGAIDSAPTARAAAFGRESIRATRGKYPPRAGTGARLLTGQKSPKAAGAIRRAPDPPRLHFGGRNRARFLPPPKGQSPHLRDEGRGAGTLAAEPRTENARSLAALPKLRGSFGTGDAASPAPPGSVPKVGCWVVDRSRGDRPHRAIRGSRGRIQPSGGALILHPPGAFLLDRQAARSLFPGEKRMGGRKRFPLGKKEARPLAARKS